MASEEPLEKKKYPKEKRYSTEQEPTFRQSPPPQEYRDYYNDKGEKIREYYGDIPPKHQPKYREYYNDQGIVREYVYHEGEYAKPQRKYEKEGKLSSSRQQATSPSTSTEDLPRQAETRG